MDNRGKPWSIDDDQKLMETPCLPNAYFAQHMGRTDNAIKCRRSHLAAKMHQNDPATPLEEYVRVMGAEFDQASALLAEWSQKRASMTQFLDANRNKRKYQQEPPPADPHQQASITLICKRICDEGGNMAGLWGQPALLPTLVQHYPGFEAYARVCQVLAAQP
jgi:hypothetical protein